MLKLWFYTYSLMEDLEDRISLGDKKIIEKRIKRVKKGYFLEFDGNSSVIFRFRKYRKGIAVTRNRDFHGVAKDSLLVKLFGYNTGMSEEKLNRFCYEEMVSYIENNLRLNKWKVYHTDRYS